MKIRTLIGLATILLSSQAGSAQDLPDPRSPRIPSPRTVDELVPGVLKVLEEFGIRRGSRILMVSDDSIEPLVEKALFQVLGQLGAHRELIVLPGRNYQSTLDQIQLWGLNWWPDWVWDTAAAHYQAIVSPSYLVHIHTSKGKLRMMPWLEQNNLRYFRVREPAAKLAYRPWVDYPKELEMAIMEKVVSLLPRGRSRVEVSDPEGTHFSYDDNWDWFVELWESGRRSINAGSLHVTGSPIQYLNARGIFVATDTHVGPLEEPIRLRFEESRITAIEGGGRFGDYMRTEVARLSDKEFVTTKGYGVPGPRHLTGIGWLEEAAFMTHPKWIRVPTYDGGPDRFSTAFNKWLGMGRSGVFHVAVGMSESTAWGPAPMPAGERDWHIDFLNYFTTLTIGDSVIIRNGRLTALDDPDVRRVASRYGDPDELLREDWIPAIPGVNVKQ